MEEEEEENEAGMCRVGSSIAQNKCKMISKCKMSYQKCIKCKINNTKCTNKNVKMQNVNANTKCPILPMLSSHCLSSSQG